MRILSELGLEDYAERLANQLSGGERQMVLIAQALVREPKVLLLDEPVSNLDIRNQLEILDLIRRVTREKEISTIVVLHDLNLAAKYADRVVILNSGKVHAQGKPKDIFRPEILSRVYGVEVKIYSNDNTIHVFPAKVVEKA